MENDLIRKIRTTVSKNESAQEEDVRSLMILIRKMLDKMSPSDQKSYLILRLFCNWTAHNEITNSNTGLRILAGINDTLVSVKKSKDGRKIQNKISQAIGYQALRNELKSFLYHIGVDQTFVSNNGVWANYIIHLVEIIRDVPLAFPPLSKLDPTKLKIYNGVAQNPIKPGAGVVSIWISSVDNQSLRVKGIGGTMCLHIKTEETTTIVVPLLIDVSL